MKMNYLILLDFKKYSDEDLLAFGEDFGTRMTGKPRYAGEQTQLGITQTSLGAYKLAYSNASDGGRSLRDIREAQRNAFLAEVMLLVRLMETHTTEDITFFTEAGFKVRNKPVKEEGPLPKAALDYVKLGIKSGTVIGKAKKLPKSVVQIAVEYSTDNGVTWHNGTYSSGKKFLLEELTPRMDYLVRICYLGTRQRTGDWSKPLPVFVV